MGAGLFTNDLFNGEALGGPWIESDRGIFRANLFDAQPLGQTTPDASSGSKTATATPSEKAAGASASGGKSAGTAITTGGGSATPAALPEGTATESEFPWLPVALVGGGLVLTVGAILLFTGKKKAPVTSNKRRRGHR